MRVYSCAVYIPAQYPAVNDRTVLRATSTGGRVVMPLCCSTGTWYRYPGWLAGGLVVVYSQYTGTGMFLQE